MFEIIIPVYNSRKTLDRALCSIGMQTARRRLLVTIVDDCSDEKYDDILARYNGFINYRVLRTPQNGGAGVARNVGIENAMGDYLMFMDSDDCLSTPLAASTILTECYSKWPDIFELKTVQECDKGIILRQDYNCTFIHGKVFRTQFLLENNIRFPTIRYNEDSAFCCICYNLAGENKILRLDYEIYTWLNNQDSTVRAMKDYYSRGILQFVQGRQFVYDVLEEHKVHDKAIKDVFTNIVTLYYMGVDFEYGATDMYEPYCEEVAKYLKHVKFWEVYEENEEMRKILYERYKAWKYNPRYVEIMYLPRIGIIEWFEEITQKYIN